MSQRPVIAVDFDGTLAEHRYPEIGAEVPGAIEWCKRWQAAGARLILLTMRSEEQAGPDPPGHSVLKAAVDWCSARGLEFWAVNWTRDQASWSKSRKVYAHVYVDDASACAPLIQPEVCDLPVDESCPRPYLDWSAVGPSVMRWIEGRG